MKKSLLWTLVCFFVSISALLAQTCGGIEMKEGSGFEMNTLDGKGKITGKIVYKIMKAEKEAAGVALTMAMEVFDPKGQSQLKNNYQLHCNGNTIFLDASSMISEDQLKSFKNMEMKYTYENIEIPTKMTVGDKLKDASVKGEGQSASIPVRFSMVMKNRNVTAEEKVTVPAGTFDAFKINSDMNMQMVMAIPIKVDMQTISYRAPGVLWDIKTETFRKGKLVAASELVKIY